MKSIGNHIRLLLGLALIGGACGSAATAQIPVDSCSQPGHHCVVQGQTWNDIANIYGVNVDRLQEANNLSAGTSNTAQPRPNWSLHIPRVTPTTTTTTTSTVAPPPPPTTTTTVPVTTSTQPPTTTSTTTTTVAPTTTQIPTTTSPPVGSAFSATFENESEFYDRFQLGVHFRHIGNGGSVNDSEGVQWGTPMSGDHDHSCGGPDTQRTFTVTPQNDGPGADYRNSEVFWWCAPGGDVTKGHIMTGMASVDGYTIISFAPNRNFVNVNRVCWDINLTALTGRKWWGVAIVDEGRFQASGRRLDYVGDPGVDESALNPHRDDFMMLYQDNNIRTFNDGPSAVGNRDEANEFSVNDKAKRYKHCMIELPTGHIRIEQERLNGQTYVRTVPGTFPDNARVIFLDDSYTPGKEEPALGFTWHWDNIVVS